MKWNDLTLTIFVLFFLLVTSIFGGAIFETWYDYADSVTYEEEEDIFGTAIFGVAILELDEDGEPVKEESQWNFFTDTWEFFSAVQVFGVIGGELITPIFWLLEAFFAILVVRLIRGVSS